MEHMSQSRPDFGLGVVRKSLNPFQLLDALAVKKVFSVVTLGSCVLRRTSSSVACFRLENHHTVGSHSREKVSIQVIVVFLY